METIIEQMTADSVVEQVIELVSQAWKTERRGYHGKWVTAGGGGSGPGISAGEARRLRVQAARNQQMAAARPPQQTMAARVSQARPSQQNKAAAVAAQVQGAPDIEKLVAAQVQTELENKAAQIRKDAVAEVSKLRTDFEQEEHDRRKRKILIELGVTILGFIGAMIGLKYGIGEPEAIGIATAPFLIQPIIEFFKKV